MADEDEIDILGDFSFNSCLAQNNQGIPSCSDREDTVHPQWLLDSTATNWYDSQIKNNNRPKDGPLRKLSGNNSRKLQLVESETLWSQEERDILNKEMEKHGQNSHRIAESLKTKTIAEIQALIEVEHGVNLETQAIGVFKHEEYDNIPAVVQEEVIMGDIITIQDTINMVSTALPTIPCTKKSPKKKNYLKSSKSLLKPNILDLKEPGLVTISPSEIFYDDDLNVGSTESIGTEIDAGDAVLRNLAKQHKEKIKGGKKIGNHRRKVSRNYDKSKNKDILKSPQGRQRIDSGVSEDAKSPKMQIILGSGQALPLSEGEQVIKIEKKKDSEPESDIEIDIDSDKEVDTQHTKNSIELCENRLKPMTDETPVAVPLRKFEPMPKRRKKINLDGGGGCTIMHTAAGDLYEVSREPRRERPPRNHPVQLIRCLVYNDDKPAPCSVSLNVSALIAMDAHAHTSRGEVMGLLGGVASAAPPTAPRAPPHLLLAAYCRAAAANARTHCDMDPVSQSMAAEALRARGLEVCGWHHSHPAFPAAPSAQDLRSQHALQVALERAPPPHTPRTPFLALITSQHWPPGRDASQYTCFRVEESEGGAESAGYALRVRVAADVCAGGVARLLRELAALRRAQGDTQGDVQGDALAVDMARDVCPIAGITYLDKLISSVSRHLRSACYADDDAVRTRLLQGIREVFS